MWQTFVTASTGNTRFTLALATEEVTIAGNRSCRIFVNQIELIEFSIVYKKMKFRNYRWGRNHIVGNQHQRLEQNVEVYTHRKFCHLHPVDSDIGRFGGHTHHLQILFQSKRTRHILFGRVPLKEFNKKLELMIAKCQKYQELSETPSK